MIRIKLEETCPKVTEAFPAKSLRVSPKAAFENQTNFGRPLASHTTFHEHYRLLANLSSFTSSHRHVSELPLSYPPPPGVPLRSLKNYQYSTEVQNFQQNLAPVLVTILSNSLVCSRKLIISTDFYRYCAPTCQHQ